MAVIKWREGYDTGVEEIDTQHKKIVDLIEQMHCLIRDKGGVNDLQIILNDLVEYTQYHFDTEERMMKELDYHGIENHQAKHTKLIEDVEKHKEKLLSSFPDGTQDFYRFLRDWLIDHILASDKEFGTFVLSQKGEGAA